MARSNDDMEDLYDLLNRADAALRQEPEQEEEDFEPEYEDGPDSDATMVFRNAANRYGKDVRNAANNYGRQPSRDDVYEDDEYEDEEPPAGPSIRAYNADFQERRKSASDRTPRRTASADQPRQQSAPRSQQQPPARSRQQPAEPAPAKGKPQKQKKKGKGCLTVLILVVVIIVAGVLAFNAFFQPPKSEYSIGDRKPGTTTILLCGTDLSGDRTDTMMLLYIDSKEKQAGLLTLPRDTYTETDYGASNKLNSAYGRNGCGEEGMEVLLDYVQSIIGYRPDGYMLVGLPMICELVDLMGGVEFEVPQDMTFDGLGLGGSITLEEGLQSLTGEQAIGLLRFRYGYYNQDLGRQDVHKQFLKTCLGQWTKVSNVSKIPAVIDLFKNECMSNLSVGNYAWLGVQLMRCGFSDIYTDTLPGYATMVGDQSYYVLNPQEVAALIQEKYNPYTREITVNDLHIVTN